MEFWDNIINTALLGTSKKPLTEEELSDDLKEALSAVNALTLDPEDKFLYMSSLAFNYRQCGVTALKKEIIPEDYAPSEEKPHCSASMLQCLSDILHEENNGLLKIWLQLCESGHYIVSPEFIPVLFSIAEKNKNLKSLVIDCCGKRGEWLSRFNNSWNFYLTDSIEETWSTGSLEQRKEVLRTLRKTEPLKAREWLQQVWDQENANTKLELLKELSENRSLEDESWLQSLLKEKGVKVKEEVFSLLKKIPDSILVRAYQEVLTTSLSLKKEKAMLGLVNRVKVELKMPATINEIVLASGIDKLSNTKGLSDEEYIVAQLLNYIPPSFLESFYGLTPEEIIEAFGKDKTGGNFIPALAHSVALFNSSSWALAFAKSSANLYSDITMLLPQKEFEEYIIKYFDQYPNDSVRLATQRKEEWSAGFTLSILNYTSKNIYQYNRNFYNQLIPLFPVKIKEELKKITPVEELHRAAWENIRDHIYNLISIKEQILKSFNKLN